MKYRYLNRNFASLYRYFIRDSSICTETDLLAADICRRRERYAYILIGEITRIILDISIPVSVLCAAQHGLYVRMFKQLRWPAAYYFIIAYAIISLVLMPLQYAQILVLRDVIYFFKMQLQYECQRAFHWRSIAAASFTYAASRIYDLRKVARPAYV